jgi:hypothetical protein
MKELKEYRAKLLDRLEEAAKAFRDACLAVNDPDAPLEVNGWNVHQLAVHTRDIDRLVYGFRIRRTAVEDDPIFSKFDGDTFMKENYDADEPLQDVLAGLVESIEALTALLRALPDEAWSRVSRHPMLGSGLTLQSWVEKGLAHIEEHLETVQEQNAS